MHRQLNGFLLERYIDTRRSQPFLRPIIPLSIGSPDDPAALHNVPPRNDPLWVVCHEDRRSKGLSRRPSGLQVSKRKDSPYRSGRSPHWIKSKNPTAPAVKREAEEDWGR